MKLKPNKIYIIFSGMQYNLGICEHIQTCSRKRPGMCQGLSLSPSEESKRVLCFYVLKSHLSYERRNKKK